jgi:hypothetical protein
LGAFGTVLAGTLLGVAKQWSQCFSVARI